MQAETVKTLEKSRRLERVLRAHGEHWVGDGFRVKSVISPNGDPRVQSPFLLLDHAASHYFESAPGAERRGVGEHPHRGFETVTFAYKGEIEHRDSSGGGGTIGAGDVQWMTAARGVVHEEKHSRRFTDQGGDLEMVQLWVNLPARQKMTDPGYQSLLDKDFPRVSVGAARARLVAGTLGKEHGPAKTHTPITVFDMTFSETGSAEFELPNNFSTLVFAVEGRFQLGNQTDQTNQTAQSGVPAEVISAGQMAALERGVGSLVRVHADKGARVLVLSGEPLDEPVASYGPFVMNTEREIYEAIRDYQSGKMGHLS